MLLMYLIPLTLIPEYLSLCNMLKWTNQIWTKNQLKNSN